jgi:hypothetical protein
MEHLIEYKEMREAIARVRELHYVDKYANTEVCHICNTSNGIAIPYPCDTIKALDGEQ